MKFRLLLTLRGPGGEVTAPAKPDSRNEHGNRCDWDVESSNIYHLRFVFEANTLIDAWGAVDPRQISEALPSVVDLVGLKLENLKEG